jgi:hypothetical protein
VLSGLVALAFRYLLAKSEDLFKGKTNRPALNFMAKVPRFFKPIIGGAICGLTGIMFPQVRARRAAFGATLMGAVVEERREGGRGVWIDGFILFILLLVYGGWGGVGGPTDLKHIDIHIPHVCGNNRSCSSGTRRWTGSSPTRATPLSSSSASSPSR